MLTQLSVKNFKGVPHLESSELISTHKGTVEFSIDKPNVIVGPNGSGKSALLTALAVRHLAFFSNRSAFDDHYMTAREADAFWTRTRQWGNDYEWLQGLDCDSDNAPVQYYRPGHVPGNEKSIAASMMIGYFEEAKAYGRLVKDKSSGQQAQATQTSMLNALKGEDLPQAFGYVNWHFGKETRDFDRPNDHSAMAHQAEVLKRLLVPADGARPMVLMDEPEQSLDALAQASLWSAISHSDPAKLQVVVATHSLYPLLQPEKFHIIEARKGYIKEVLAPLN